MPGIANFEESGHCYTHTVNDPQFPRVLVLAEGFSAHATETKRLRFAEELAK